MADKILIAQLSDTRFSNSEPEVETRRDALLQFIQESVPRVDYVLFCGNLSREGSSHSFDMAKPFLKSLAEGILKRDEGRTRFRRLVVVPGPCDVGTESGFGQFVSFHDSLFEDEIKRGEVEPFKDQRGILRHLKDSHFATTALANCRD